MQIKTTINKTFDGGSVKALATADIDSNFAIHGIKVMTGSKGDFVAMPQQKGKDGNYYDIFHPISADARQALNENVVAAYEQKLAEQSAGQTAERNTAPEQQQPQGMQM